MNKKKWMIKNRFTYCEVISIKNSFSPVLTKVEIFSLKE